MVSCFKNRAARIEALKQVDLYPVISSEFCDGRTPFDVFQAAVRGGARMIQLREKHWEKKALFELAVRCREVAAAAGVLLMIDDHVDVALAAGADGVHLGQDDLPLEAARRIAPELLLGSSTHNPAEALQADAGEADYLNIGPIFPTQTKEVSYPVVGLEQMKQIARQIHIPFSVMGGIKEHHLDTLIAAGARRIAMVTEITRAPDVAARVSELRRHWR